MILVLCHPGDAAAGWLYDELRRLSDDDAELVAVEQLVYSRRIVHRITESGDSGIVHLADGRILRPERITGVVNRVAYLPTAHFATAAPADRAYAIAELAAFLLAWINGVAGRVINPPLPLDLTGGTFPITTVMHHAATAGLPAVTWRATTETEHQGAMPFLPATHAAVVFDKRVFGPLLPLELQRACIRLAVLLGVPLLEVRLHQSPEHQWRFLGASGVVDFRLAGQPLVRALARAMARVAAA